MKWSTTVGVKREPPAASQQQSRTRPVAPQGLKWKIRPRYEYVGLISSGAYSEVCRAIDTKNNNQQVAIKRMKNVSEKSTLGIRAFREIHILRHLRHPNIITLLDVLATGINDKYIERFLMEERKQKTLSNTRGSSSKSNGGFIRSLPVAIGDLYLVLELMNSDLKGMMRIKKRSESSEHEAVLTLEKVRDILFQLLEGVAYMHSMHVIHRDLKPENVLISRDNTLKITDFGLARVMGEDLIAHPDVQNNDESVTATEEETQDPPVPPFAASSLRVNTSALEINPRAAEPCRTFTEQGSMFPPFPSPTRPRRHLTPYVATRWYRAPELILLEPYTTAVDIWSVGCIFAELLELVLPRDMRRGPLFPGESCGVLSPKDAIDPHKSREDQLRESYASPSGQLSVIFDVIGTPSDADLSHLDAVTAERLRGLEKKKGTGFYDRYSPVGSPEAVELLSLMLHFDPRRRISAAQALEHAFFEGISIQHKALDRADSPSPISLEPMDFSKETKRESKDSTLKSGIVLEVMYYRKRDRLNGTAQISVRL